MIMTWRDCEESPNFVLLDDGRVEDDKRDLREDWKRTGETET
jgi:hypothetical protein